MDPITAILVNIVIGLVLSGVSALSQQATATEQKKTVAGIRGSVQSGGAVPVSFMMGTIGSAGKLEYKNTFGNSGETPNAFLVDVISLGDLPITALTALYVNTEEVTLSTSGHTSKGYPVAEKKNGSKDTLWWEFYDGTQTTAATYLTTSFGSDATRPWDSDMIGRGVPYATLTARLDREKWSGFPTYMREVQGIPLYDPTKDTTVGGSGSQRLATPATWAFSDNPAVMIYNILLGIYYSGAWVWGGAGLRDADGTINEDAVAYRLPYATWAAAINACNTSVSLKGGGSEKRFRAGREVFASESPVDVINELLVACTGRMSEAAGIYTILVGAAASAIASFTDDDVVISEGQTFEPFPALDEIVNGATATYLSPQQAWERKDAAPYYRSDLETLDDGRRQIKGLSLDVVFSGTQAQRVLKATVRDGRHFWRWVETLPPKFGAYRPLEVLSWTSDRNQLTTKDVLITAMTEGPDGKVVVGLQEVDATDHDWTAASDESDISYAPVTPIEPGAHVLSGWTVDPAYMEDQDANGWLPSIEVSFDGLLDDVKAVHIQVREEWSARVIFDGRLDYDETVASPSAIINASFLPNSDYEARGRFLPFSGRPSTWSAWLGATTPNVAPVPFGSITNEELAQKWRDGIEFIVGNGPALLEDRIMAALDALAGSVTTNTMASDRDRRAVSAVVDDVQAAVVSEISARASADTALAASILDVAAQSASGLAEGLFTVQAQSAPSGVAVRLALMARVTTNDDFVDTGMLIDLVSDGAGGYTSFIVLKADSIYLTDGDTSTTPFTFSNGEATLAVANIGTVVAGLLQKRDGSTYFNLNTGALRVST